MAGYIPAIFIVQIIVSLILFVGADESHLPVRSVLLFRRGVHRTPAPPTARGKVCKQITTGRRDADPYNVPNSLYL